MTENRIEPRRRIRFLPEKLWILHRHNPEAPGSGQICYLLAPTRKELWENIEQEEFLGTGMTKKMLMKQGWRAEEARVALLLQKSLWTRNFRKKLKRRRGKD